MWIQPKIDWNANNYFNATDYNRIKNNIKEIRELAVKLYKPFTIVDMGADKTYVDYYYADEINKMESNIDVIVSGTYPFAVGQSKQFYENQPFVDYIELNRLEVACNTMYMNLYGQDVGRLKLGFRLNGGDF